MSDAWSRLVPRLVELKDLSSAISLLNWDHAVMMPPNGAGPRARALATLESIGHDRLTDPEIGRLLEELEGAEDLDEDQRASVRVLKRDYEKATKVPRDLVKALAEAQGKGYQAWTQAKPADDFSIFEPHLRRVVELKREEADALGWEEERYDALLDQFEPGMTAAEVRESFAKLVEGLEPLIDSVLGKAGHRPDWLVHEYDPQRQMAFCNWLVAHLGYDTDSGRLDSSPHPFTIQVSLGDVRQTTRADADNLLASVYAAIHETGHALYEQGLPPELADLPSGRTPSLGIHESQSRLWENQVGRSEAFSSFLLPQLKEHFPQELGMVSPAEFYRGVNHPHRTMIRVTADELTYNLHVVMRFELETAMFADELDVADLPQAWNETFEKHLGIRPKRMSDGVLQDMHWSMGALGYFPTYTLGTMYAGAFFQKAAEEIGDLNAAMRNGETRELLEWLREKIHRHAYRYEAKDLAQRVTGEPVSADPLLDYLREKYTSLYDVTV
ncbi:MAG: carboxypeptidase M32 [Actinomycetota bacterium]|nr:carboxypeptidase M32 [Actinomycetota bacterium]